MLIYEAVFPVFLAVPFLSERRGRDLRRELVRNGAILVAMLATIGLIRIAIGESRLEHLDARHAAMVALRNTILGPIFSLGSYLRGPLYALPRLTAIEWLLLLASFGLMLGALTFLATRTVGARVRSTPVAPAREASSEPPEGGRLLRLGGTGLVILVLAYPLTVLGNCGNWGIGSRVNLAAAVGAGLIIACVIAGGLRADTVHEGAVRLARLQAGEHHVRARQEGCRADQVERLATLESGSRRRVA